MIDRVVLIVLDSLGVGALPDAAQFQDAGAATLQHIFKERGGLEIPNLCRLGLGEIAAISCAKNDIVASFAKMAAQSSNKDTTSGHWELTGLILSEAFPTYPQGFPGDIVQAFENAIGQKILGNYARSGTRILEELGQQHLETGQPIVYTSADSVFQIATHEKVTPVETLYQYCHMAREILTGPHSIVRVIARPFRGQSGAFERINDQRKDFSISPPAATLLDSIKAQGYFSIGVGKIGDIFGHRGLTEEIHTRDNMDGVEQILAAMQRTQKQKGLIFANLVDFDMVYGHRRNVAGYAAALEQFDTRLPELMEKLSPEDMLIITADHGCDPTYASHTDHTREYVPMLAYGHKVQQGVDLGIRSTFADCGQTIADIFHAQALAHGKSFKDEILSK
jgi:phosphopentomutase